MHKGKIIALIIMAILFIHPARVAFIQIGEYSDTYSLIMFLITLFGTLAAVIIGGKKVPEENK